MERENAIDDRVNRLTMRDSIFCEADVAGSGCGMETEMWDLKGGGSKERLERKNTDIQWLH
jgi:hypothetical protein